MQIASVFRLLKVSAAPALFCAAAIGLLSFYLADNRDDSPTSNMSSLSAEDPFAEAQFSLNIKDLEIAASKGDIPAKLEVARRYARGQGVERNEARAFAYFQNITQQFWTIEPRDGRAFGIPEAFRALAEYYRKGNVEAKVKADPAQSERLLRYSASYFGDAASQVELAMLILSGEAPTKNALIAVHWLQNASRKGYAPAQALLGNMLWRGQGVKRVAGDGLGLLAVANRNVLPEDRQWVSEMYAAARAEASLSEVLEANAFIAQESNALRLPLTNDFLIAGANEANGDAGQAGTGAKSVAAVAPVPAGDSPLSSAQVTLVKPDPQQAGTAPLRFMPASGSVKIDVKTKANTPLPQ